MLSVDTNILLYSLNNDCPEYAKASAFIDSIATEEAVICELVLVELYLLLRNPAVVARPLASDAAAELCNAYRRNPAWRLVDGAPVMNEVWEMASRAPFARRRIIDARLALTLRHHGVTRFATRNTKDFQGLGFDELLNPLA